MNRHSTIRRVAEQIKQQLSFGSAWGWALGTVLLLLTLLVTAAQVTPSNSSWKMVSVLQKLSGEVEETFQQSRALLFGTVLADTDGDGIDDAVDLDDDNDGILDTQECSGSSVLEYPNGPPVGSMAGYIRDQTVIASVTNMLAGGGITLTGFTTTSKSVLNIDATTYATAVTNNEYIEYGFTTTTSLSNKQIVGVSFGRNFFNGTYKIAVAISDNNFATKQDLAVDYLASGSGTTYLRFNLPTTTYFLSPSKSYKVRVYFYGNTTADDFDDFSIEVGSCDPDGDGILNWLDLDSDGDGCPDAIEGGALFTAANLTSTSALAGAVSTASTSLGVPLIAGSGQSVGYSQNAAVNGCAETCGNGIDDDLNGYVDEFDPACASSSTVVSCTALAPPAVFNIRQNWSTSTSNGLATSQSPTVADLNGDGIPEILVAAAGGTGYRYYNGKGTNATKTTNDYVITLNTPVGQPTSQAAVADIDRDGVPEVIAVSSTGFVYVFGNVGGNASGTQSNTGTTGYRYRSNVATPFFYGSPRVTDIDEDGVPEISVGTDIFKFNLVAKTLTRVVTGNASLPHGKDQMSWGADPVIVDIIPSNPGKEIVAGSRVYAVDLVTGVTTTLKDLNSLTAVVPANSDGPTAVGDLDLDGDLDVTYADATNFYIWDPNGNKLLFRQANWTSGSLRGMPLIANIYNEQVNNGKSTNLPEVVLTTTTAISAFNLNKLTGSLWNLSTTDGSGETGITAFDLNGDGKLELIYNDENNIRVINGDLATPVNLVTFASGTATWMEHPVVADVDGDGSADFATVTGSAVAFVGELRVFSGGTGVPWQAARPIWNQRGYRYLNINDNLTVPIQEQNSAAIIPAGTNRRAFNTYNAQRNTNYALPDGVVPAPDAIASVVSTTFNCPTIQLTYTVQNAGPGALPANTPVSFFMGNPASGTATLISSTTLATVVLSGTTVTFTTTLQSTITGQKVYVAINTMGTSLPLSGSASFGGQTGISECDYTNNIAASAQTYICTDTDGDGIPDIDDLDDDNDGILDEVECSTFELNPFTGSPATVGGTVGPVAYTLTTSSTTNLPIIASSVSSNTFSGFNTLNYSAPIAGADAINLLAYGAVNAQSGRLTITFGSPVTNPVLHLNNLDYAALSLSATVGLQAGQLSKLSGNSQLQVVGYEISDVDPTTFEMNGNQLLSAYGSVRLAGTFTRIMIDVSKKNASIDGFWLRLTSDTECDLDGDGIPNRLDLDSDGDGCPDALEGAGPFTARNLFASPMAGGNTGSTYIGTSNDPITQNLGTSVGPTGIPLIAGTGQAIGTSQSMSTVGDACIDFGEGTIDCSKTQLNPAPVAGTARQLTLMVVVNVTKAGTFPLTVSGSGMSLANGISSITTTKTGVQSFYIPLNYDGSTLSTLTFTVGRAGSCSADLTKPAKPAITDVWTLDCVPIVGPKLR